MLLHTLLTFPRTQRSIGEIKRLHRDVTIGEGSGKISLRRVRREVQMMGPWLLLAVLVHWRKLDIKTRWRVLRRAAIDGGCST